MRRFPALIIKALSGDTRIALLVLCAYTCPTIANAGVDSLCDQRSKNDVTLNVAVADLGIELIDVPGDDALQPLDLDIAIDMEEFRVPTIDDDILLRRLFDRTRGRESAEYSVPVMTLNPPLAELAEPAIRDVDTELMNRSADSNAEAANDSPPAVSTRVPGLTDDDLRRYRRKMYRTDI